MFFVYKVIHKGARQKAIQKKREFGIGRTNKDFYYKYPKSKQNYGMTEAERSKLIEDIGTPFKELMRSKRMRSVKKYVKGKDF